MDVSVGGKIEGTAPSLYDKSARPAASVSRTKAYRRAVCAGGLRCCNRRENSPADLLREERHAVAPPLLRGETAAVALVLLPDRVEDLGESGASLGELLALDLVHAVQIGHVLVVIAERDRPLAVRFRAEAQILERLLRH